MYQERVIAGADDAGRLIGAPTCETVVMRVPDVKTRLDDLILICANCHRMIHRRNPWVTPDQLHALVAANA